MSLLIFIFLLNQCLSPFSFLFFLFSLSSTLLFFPFSFFLFSFPFPFYPFFPSFSFPLPFFPFPILFSPSRFLVSEGAVCPCPSPLAIPIGGLAVVAFWRSPHGPLGSGPPGAGHSRRRKRKEKGKRAALIFLPRPV